jgi:hypothetical protein
MSQQDDHITEEREPRYEQMIASVEKFYGSHSPSTLLTAAEQTNILANVRERLAEHAIKRPESVSHDDTQRESEPIAMSRAMPVRKVSTRARRIGQTLSACVAVFIVAILIGGGWFLFFRQGLPNTAMQGAIMSPSTGVVTAPITKHSQVNGIEASMQVTSGPYFLSELLEANLALTNHTNTTLIINGFLRNGMCMYSPSVQSTVLFVNSTGGNNPQYIIPGLTDHPMNMLCPLSTVQLKPGQTIKVSQDIPLVKSGNITLTMGARFYHKQSDNNGQVTSMFDPLAGHWPTFQLAVVSHPPSNRVISLQWHGTRVNINAPAPALSNLRYFFACWQEGDETGNLPWAPLAKPELDASQCAGSAAKWQFSVGAPGYMIVNGKYPF